MTCGTSLEGDLGYHHQHYHHGHQHHHHHNHHQHHQNHDYVPGCNLSTSSTPPIPSTPTPSTPHVSLFLNLNMLKMLMRMPSPYFLDMLRGCPHNISCCNPLQQIVDLDTIREMLRGGRSSHQRKPSCQVNNSFLLPQSSSTSSSTSSFTT